MGNISVIMNRPVYLGQAILDLGKIILYKFHSILQLCYMDTDSTLRPRISMKTSLMTLRLDSTQVATTLIILFP